MNTRTAKVKCHTMSRRNFLIMSLWGMAAGIAIPFGSGAAAQTAETAPGSAKVLIVYYSRSGNTGEVAKLIQEKMGGDMVELKTVEPYPSEYRATTEQAKRELESGFLPPLSTTVENIDAYDVVFLGSPNWWGTYSMPVRSFLAAHDLSGKTVMPFITHEGSGLGRSVTDLKTLCPNATVLDGLAIRGSRASSSRDEVARWLTKLGLTK